MQMNNDTDSEVMQRDPRKECISLDLINADQFPEWLLKDPVEGEIRALLVNASLSGCCFVCNKKNTLPTNVKIELFEDDKELWRIDVNFDIKWHKDDIAIKYHAFGLAINPLTDADRIIWNELFESLLRGERQSVFCNIWPR